MHAVLAYPTNGHSDWFQLSSFYHFDECLTETSGIFSGLTPPGIFYDGCVTWKAAPVPFQLGSVYDKCWVCLANGLTVNSMVLGFEAVLEAVGHGQPGADIFVLAVSFRVAFVSAIRRPQSQSVLAIGLRAFTLRDMTGFKILFTRQVHISEHDRWDILEPQMAANVTSEWFWMSFVFIFNPFKKGGLSL